MGTVVGALADLGYGWAYRVLDAQYFGVPQRRRRVFIVAGRHLGVADVAGPVSVLLEPEGVRGDLAPGNSTGQDIARAASPSPSGRSAVAERERERERVFLLHSFGQYEADVVTSTMASRDYKSATDLVVTA
jgi:DNA (cytosine-5)-methyltransferase 1